MIEVDGLWKSFRQRRGEVVAAAEVTFRVDRGETVGLVGESGSGKSTVGRCIVGLTGIDRGRVAVDGETVAEPRRRIRVGGAMRGRLQIVFQDPAGSMNPAYTVRGWLADALRPLGLNRGECDARIAELLEQVGLDERFLERRARQLSGGQLQRVAIARAIAPKPEFVFLDEPTSALDLSVQGQIVNLLGDLQRDYRHAYLFASHDLAVVRTLAHRVLVMYLGRVVEQGPVATVLREPAHPYTRALLVAAGMAARSEEAAPRGEVARPAAGGCAYADRCPFVHARCREEAPPLERVAASPGHLAACWLVPEGRVQPYPALSPTASPRRPTAKEESNDISGP